MHKINVLASSPGFPAFFGIRRSQPLFKSEAAIKRVGRPGNVNVLLGSAKTVLSSRRPYS